jgi:hypothetical protein
MSLAGSVAPQHPRCAAIFSVMLVLRCKCAHLRSPAAGWHGGCFSFTRIQGAWLPRARHRVFPTQQLHSTAARARSPAPGRVRDCLNGAPATRVFCATWRTGASPEHVTRHRRDRCHRQWRADVNACLTRCQKVRSVYDRTRLFTSATRWRATGPQACRHRCRAWFVCLVGLVELVELACTASCRA